MRVFLCFSVSEDAIPMEIQLHDPVNVLRRKANESLRSRGALSGTASFYLVWGGSVIAIEDEDTPVSVLQLEKDAPIQVVFPSTSFLSNPSTAIQWLPKVFNLQVDHPLRCEQRDTSAIELLNLFCEWAATKEASHLWSPDPSKLETLTKALRELESPEPVFMGHRHIKFFGEYGCVLVSSVLSADDTVTLKLLCLDNWEFQIHCGQRGGIAFTSVPHQAATKFLYVGTCQNIEYRSFLACAETLIREAQQLRGDKRSAASNAQGHQKTPAFIQAIMQDAIKKTQNGAVLGKTAPKGGFTDVGRHTGGKERDTTWPLLRAVLQDLVEESFFLQEAFCQLHLCMLESITSLLQDGRRNLSATHARSLLGGAMQGLRESVLECTECWPYFEDASLQYFGARTVRLKHELKLFQLKDAKAVANLYELRALKKEEFAQELLQLNIPKAPNTCIQDYDINKARSLALENLRVVPIPFSFRHQAVKCEGVDLSSLTLKSMFEWITSPEIKGRDDSLESAFLICRTVETFFYRLSCTEINEERWTINQVCEKCKFIGVIIDEYRLVVSTLYKNETKRIRSLADLRSRELVVVWAGFCVIHKMVSFQHPVLHAYRPALDPNDLQHLTLSDQLSTDALGQIATYLRDHTSSKQFYAFSLRNGDRTFDVAREYAGQKLMNELRREKLDAETRKENHWRQVCEKKAELARLDQKLSSLRSDLNTWERILNSTVRPRYCRWNPTSEDNNKRYHEANGKVNDLQNQVNNVLSRIKSVEHPPKPVLQPLPRYDENALPILFFLQMPDEFQVLSRFSFLAQQMLLPSGKIAVAESPTGNQRFDVSSMIRCQGPVTVWRNYYTDSSSGRAYGAMNPPLLLGSECSLPRDWHPKNVRLYSSKESGVWYPDGLTPKLYWGVNNSGLDRREESYFNPFMCLPYEVFVDTFTEKLNNLELQWAIKQCSENTSSSRENWAEAFQDIFRKTEEFTGKYEYLSFCAIRAYPYQQIRKLCVALNEKTLPLTEPLVRIIIMQTLSHVGPLQEDASPPLWKVDIFPGSEGWHSLCKELDDLADEIEGKTREHSALLTLGLVAAYAAQWDVGCLGVSRKFATISRKWADNEVSAMKTCEPKNVPLFRARACVFYLYAILCYGGDLSQEDVAGLCELSLLAESCRIFDEETDMSDDIKALNHAARDFLSKKLEFMISYVQPEILSRTIELTFEGQECRRWKRVTTHSGKVATTCFEAISGSGHLISVNVLTGTMLYDGLPPRRLPSSITRHKLYQRTFKDHNFDVVEKDGALETSRLINDKTYSFRNSNGHIVVVEQDGANTTRLELMDGTQEGVAGWGQLLPARLAQMHSHWLCRKRGLLILRPPRFNEFDVFYILKGSDAFTSGRGGKWRCYRIPSQLRRKNWVDLLADIEKFDELISFDRTGKESLFAVLQKFEEIRFIHCFLKPEGQITFEFPRFGLEFELDRDGRLHSKNFAGFFLRSNQKFRRTLHGFEQYLILEAFASTKQSKVLIPRGEVMKIDGAIKISTSEACDESLTYHVYDIHHRFGTLDPPAGKNAIEARLQLASLHAASHTQVPDSPSMPTGAERAIELVRQSFVNRPLTQGEHRHLKFLTAQANDVPALSLISTWLDASSSDLYFLFKKTGAPTRLRRNDIAATHYTLLKQKGLLPARSRLTDEEEKQILGEKIVKPSTLGVEYHCEHTAPFDLTQVQARKVHRTTTELHQWRPAFGRTRDFRGEMQCTPDAKHNRAEKMLVALGDDSRSIHESAVTELKSMLVYEESRDTAVVFPLEVQDIESTTRIAHDTCSELIKSWNIHQNDHVAHLHGGLEQLSVALEKLHKKCEGARKSAENCILKFISYVPTYGSFVALRFAMRRSVNLEPVVTFRDLVVSAGSKDALKRLNPLMSEVFLDKVYSQILQLLSLCVLEDKLERMVMIARSNDTVELKRELMNTDRSWEVKQFPLWLAFEVEQRIQIREIQYHVARFCLENPSKITQLNMGEGKTRVILPMLLLQLAGPGRLVRLHFLSPLLSEAYEYLHRTLTAGLFNRKLFQLPFHRSVNVDAHEARALRYSLQRCQTTFGAVCVAPEHRLSLHLKRIEGCKDVDVQKSMEEVESLPYFDIFDESDEILHHKYQLIYAKGSCIPLPQGKERLSAAQAVLHEIQRSLTVAKLLDRSDAVTCSPGSGSGNGSFKKITLFQGKSLDRIRLDLLEAIATGILNDPPYFMRWLREHDQVEIMKEYVVDHKKGLEWLKSHDLRLEQSHVDQLTALRGLLACRVLEHCLCRRFRVHYGIDPRRNDPSKETQQRVAVPYRACDSPADRAEYAHPDTVIILSQLSYYYQGLSESETHELINSLLKCGPEAQRKEYDIWLSFGVGSVSVEEQRRLDDVRKLDPTNKMQMSSLHKAFQYNMAAIDFWLSKCVFPRETMQFPQRLVANACHLAHNRSKNNTGFSGTKDNHLLLPPQVEQSIPEVQVLQATDGKMVDLILQNDKIVRLGPNETQDDVLSLSVQNGIQAIIDAGAYMAGLSNEVVANRLIELLLLHHSQFKGVVFFSRDADTWVIKAKDGRSWNRGSSPITEAEAIVFYDEQRCRGVDMKLPSTSIAFVSISVGMTKDKLMQAAGRMRKLDRGQRLEFLLPNEVAQKIKDDLESSYVSQQTSPIRLLMSSVGLGKLITTADMLRWILKNTVDQIASALPEWALQASFFATTKDARARTIDEVLSVEDLYSRAVGGDRVNSFVCEMIRMNVDRVSAMGIQIDDDNMTLLGKVQKHSDRYGSDQFVVVSANNEECERELEVERELEREVVREVPRQLPRQAVRWDVTRLLKATTPSDLPASAEVMTLEKAFKLRHKKLSSVKWSLGGQIFVTQNFIETVLTQERYPVNDLSDFMRPVDVVVLFGSKSPRQTGITACLLVSEWEADDLLPLLYSSSLQRNCSISMANLAYLRQAADIGWTQPCKLQVPEKFKWRRLSEEMMTALQLLAGDTKFGSSGRKKALRRFLSTPEAKIAARDLVLFRGRHNFLDRSDLEEVCSLDMIGALSAVTNGVAN